MRCDTSLKSGAAWVLYWFYKSDKMSVFEARDKVFVVTGAAGGIGAGVVRAFLEEGAKVGTLLEVVVCFSGD